MIVDVYLFQRNSTVYVNRVPVVESDMMATNGVVHAVDIIVKPLRKPTVIFFQHFEVHFKT